MHVRLRNLWRCWGGTAEPRAIAEGMNPGVAIPNELVHQLVTVGEHGVAPMEG